jgi:hypothetical protein
MKILPVGAELFHEESKTDGQTNGRENGRTDKHDEANSRFSQFSEEAQKVLSIFLLNTSKDEINLTMYPVRMQFLP